MAAWGSRNVTYDGKQIPCARLWGIIGQAMASGVAPSGARLLEEAERASLYRNSQNPMIIMTSNPSKDDHLIEDDVYVRNERQRVRPLAEELGVKLARIKGDDVDGDKVERLCRICAKLGLYPVGAGESRFMFSKDPEAVFNAVGSRDWVRIYVFLKRPGSSAIDLDLSEVRQCAA